MRRPNREWLKVEAEWRERFGGPPPIRTNPGALRKVIAMLEPSAGPVLVEASEPRS